MEQFNSGRIKFHLRNQFSQNQERSDDRWKVCLAAGGGSKRRCHYCSDISGIILYIRALQGHTGRNLIDLTVQDNVMIESGFFQPLYLIGCAFNLHSIINNGLIPGGQNSSKRQTVFFLPIDPRDKGHQDPAKIDFTGQFSFCLLIPETKGIKILQRLTSLCHVVHNTCTVHGRNIKTRYFGLILIFRFEKGMTFYQTRSNVIILQGNTSSLLYSKSCEIEDWRSFVCKNISVSTRPPPKDLITTRSRLEQRE